MWCFGKWQTENFWQIFFAQSQRLEQWLWNGECTWLCKKKKKKGKYVLHMTSLTVQIYPFWNIDHLVVFRFQSGHWNDDYYCMTLQVTSNKQITMSEIQWNAIWSGFLYTTPPDWHNFFSAQPLERMMEAGEGRRFYFYVQSRLQSSAPCLLQNNSVRREGRVDYNY